jgi:shikimate dehydrogenase
MRSRRKRSGEAAIQAGPWEIFAVAGNPVFQSKSPLLFNTAFRDLAVSAQYVRLAASTAAEIMTTAREIGMGGLNITAPFKTAILEYLDEIEEDARIVNAVNTIVRRDGAYIGCNTDIAGVAQALKKGGFYGRGRKAVVLGAGGAARAAALALVRAGSSVTMINRTFERARDGANRIGCEALPLDCAADALAGSSLLVSAVSTDTLLIDPSLISPAMTVLDANYTGHSPLALEATRLGATVIDGREWLLNQALPAFELFVDRPAPVEAMHKALWKTRRDARKNIALIGFMGTGKSAVAERVSALTGMTLVDIDRRIEEEGRATIADIFRTSGEEEFRRMEQAEIEGLGLDVDQVAACGGGALVNGSNVRVLRNNCLSVWLWADVSTALARIGDRSTRPMLDSSTDIEGRARVLLDQRLPGYARTSDVLINTVGKSPDEIARRIRDEFNSALSD